MRTAGLSLALRPCLFRAAGAGRRVIARAVFMWGRLCAACPRAGTACELPAALAAERPAPSSPAAGWRPPPPPHSRGGRGADGVSAGTRLRQLSTAAAAAAEELACRAAPTWRETAAVPRRKRAAQPVPGAPGGRSRASLRAAYEAPWVTRETRTNDCQGRATAQRPPACPWQMVRRIIWRRGLEFCRVVAPVHRVYFRYLFPVCRRVGALIVI